MFAHDRRDTWRAPHFPAASTSRREQLPKVRVAHRLLACNAPSGCFALTWDSWMLGRMAESALQEPPTKCRQVSK